MHCMCCSCVVVHVPCCCVVELFHEFERVDCMFMLAHSFRSNFEGQKSREKSMRLFRRSVSFLSPPPGDLDSWAIRNENNPDAGGMIVVNPGGISSSPPGVVAVRTRLRADHPWVRRSGHANASRALAAASDPQARHAAMQSFHEAMYAPSSQAPQMALLRTWARFHKAWFGSTTPVYPITVSSLKAISAMFKSGGYGSYKNYLYAAKSYHVRAGFLWGQQLEKCAKDSTRSVLRGLGAATRSDPIGFRQAVQVALLWGPNDSDLSKPIDTAALIGTAVYFMCREIEVTGCLQHELSVEQDASSCSLLLPATKKDTFGAGTTRSVECFCELGEFCLPHYLVQYQATLKKLADKLGKDSDEMPLFPNPLGSALTKAHVVAVLREVVNEYHPGCSQDLLARITGHTFRITGARLLCGMGLDPITVAIHGRWSSNAVLSYLAEAPLLSMKARLRPVTPVSAKLSEINSNKRPFEIEEPRGVEFEQRFRVAQHIEEQYQQEQQEETETEVPVTGYVLNVVSSMVHLQKSTDEQTHNWATKCGWKWAGKRHVHSATTEPDFSSTTWKRCPKCYKGQLDDEDGTTSDTSSSSSSSD